MAANLVLSVFLFLMVIAAIKDVTGFTIPNWISGAIACLFPLAALALGLGWSAFAMHLAVGLAALLTGMALYAPGWIGGGDAKLFAAAALWFGWPDTAAFFLYSVLAGGVLALGLAGLRRLAPAMVFTAQWAKSPLFRIGGPAPYGAALAAGALMAAPKAAIFAGFAL